MGPLILPYEGTMPIIAADAFIAENAVVIGDVEIGAQSSIWYGCILRADVNIIRIGPRSNLQDGTVVHLSSRHPTIVGADVTVAHAVLLHGCTLMDGSFVGMRATVMDGVVVETGAMVAAGALVTPGKIVRRGELWAGSPARKMRALTEADIATFMDISGNYVQRGAIFRAEAAKRQGL